MWNPFTFKSRRSEEVKVSVCERLYKLSYDIMELWNKEWKGIGGVNLKALTELEALLKKLEEADDAG